MPTFHVQCLPAGAVGYTLGASRYAGKCGGYERCKVGGDVVEQRAYGVGDQVYWKKGSDAVSGGGHGVGQGSGSYATLTDVTLIRSELAQLADVVMSLRGVVADLKITERPDLMRQIPVDKRSDVQKAIANAIQAMPVMPQVNATSEDAQVIFSGSNVSQEEDAY